MQELIDICKSYNANKEPEQFMVAVVRWVTTASYSDLENFQNWILAMSCVTKELKP